MTVKELIHKLQQQAPPDALIVTFDSFGQRFEKANDIHLLEQRPTWAADFPEIGPHGAVCVG